MAQERQRHTQNARLHGIVNKDGNYQEIPGPSHTPYSLQANYRHDQAAYRPDNPVRYTRQPYNEGVSHVDVDTRSHGIALDSVQQPQYTRSNTGAAFRQPPPSSVQSSRENPVSIQSHATYYTDRGPKGQPLTPTIPPVGPHSESDTDQLSVQYTESLTSAQLPSVSTPLRFNKLNERDVENVDSTHEVVVFGPDGVGKTTIINCFIGDPNPNIKELDRQFKTQSVSVILGDKESSKIMRLNFQEADKQGNINKYEQCAVAVVVYDASSHGSLKKANQWITRIKQHIKGRPVEFILVGNKNDMIKNNEVMLKGIQLANEMKMSCLVTCARNGLYMDKLLENVAILCNQHMENDTIETRFASYLEKKFEEKDRKIEEQERRFEEKQRILEEDQRILRQHLEASLQQIQRLQDRRCTIL